MVHKRVRAESSKAALQTEAQVPSAELIVHDFSCIKDITVRFSRLTVVIGEQASGKSVTCKLYYFFTQGMRKVLFASARTGDDFKAFQDKLALEFRAIFPETAWMNDSFRIEWKMGLQHFVVTHKKRSKRIRLDLGGMEAAYAEMMDRIVDEQRKAERTKGDEENFDVQSSVYRWIDRYIDQAISVPSVDYVPAGRSFFSTMQDTVFTLLSNDIGIDYFLKEFGKKFESVRFLSSRHDHRSAIADALRTKVLHGLYEYDGKDQWIVRDANHRVKLADASSGQQEALPLLLLLSNLSSRRLSRGEGSGLVLIEEPEAHLYPTAQRAIVDCIGGLLHETGGLGCIVTTHSPFILCCLNNVITAGKVSRDDVAAYHISDGRADDIFDKELGLINAVRFDDVSTQIANGEA